jgi:hypothetical protein
MIAAFMAQNPAYSSSHVFLFLGVSAMKLWIIWMSCLCVTLMAQGFADREVLLDSVLVIDSIEYNIRGAFEDAKARSAADRWVFKTGEKLRIRTRPKVVASDLLFQVGDTITGADVVDSERLLRRRIFLSDASMVLREDSTGNILQVTTSDHWTTTILTGISNPSGDRWGFMLGLQESNFLGLGQTLQFVFVRNDVRDSWSVLFDDPHFLLPRHRLVVGYKNNSDGDSVVFAFNKPIYTRRPEWSYGVSGSYAQKDSYWYQSAIRRSVDDFLVFADTSGIDTVRELNLETSLKARTYKKIQTHQYLFRLARSTGGRHLRFMPGLLFKFEHNTYDPMNTVLHYYRMNDDLGYFAGAPQAPYMRNYSAPGFMFDLENIRYVTSRNLRNVKWTEDVPIGLKMQNQVLFNLADLGSDEDFIKLYHALGFTDLLGNSAIWVLNLETSYILSGSSFIDHSTRGMFEMLWKPANAYGLAFMHDQQLLRKFTHPQQLTLGGLEGFAGFPSFYYAGNYKFMFQLEQRIFFDHLEAVTLLPVLAFFVNGGNVFDSPSDFKLQGLDYSVGAGLRLAMSKSVLGTVNHINVSWPLNGELANGWRGVRFAVLVKNSL